MCASAYKLWSILRRGLGFAFGKVAELENVFEVAFKTKLTGGIIHPVLDNETDLDALLVPNSYKLTAEYEYYNAPETDVEAMLHVEGDASNLRQKFTALNPNAPTYERVLAEDGWSAWVNTRANMMTEIVNAIYPVGSLYMSANDTSPEVLFGGTWARIEDKFLLASGATYEAGTSGGSAEHTLEPHKHLAPIGHKNATAVALTGMYGYEDGQAFSGYKPKWTSTAASDTMSGVIVPYTSESEAETISTIPPYLAIYVWQRTA